MIAYKVVYVHGNKRTSCIAEGRYERVYNKGSIVKKVRGTLGIFCFQTLRAANNFCRSNPHWRPIRVKGIGEPSYPKTIIEWSDIGNCLSLKQYQKIYNIIDWDNTVFSIMPAPKSTVCFDSVEVLE